MFSVSFHQKLKAWSKLGSVDRINFHEKYRLTPSEFWPFIMNLVLKSRVNKPLKVLGAKKWPLNIWKFTSNNSVLFTKVSSNVNMTSFGGTLTLMKWNILNIQNFCLPNLVMALNNCWVYWARNWLWPLSDFLSSRISCFRCMYVNNQLTKLRRKIFKSLYEAY